MVIFHHHTFHDINQRVLPVIPVGCGHHEPDRRQGRLQQGQGDLEEGPVIPGAVNGRRLHQFTRNAVGNIGPQNDDVHRGHHQRKNQQKQTVLQAVPAGENHVTRQLTAVEQHGNQQEDGKESRQPEMRPGNGV